MRDYQVIHPIKHEGDVRRDGIVSLGDVEGALLTRQGYVQPLTTEAADPPLDASNETGGTPGDAEPAKPAKPGKAKKPR